MFVDFFCLLPSRLQFRRLNGRRRGKRERKRKRFFLPRLTHPKRICMYHQSTNIGSLAPIQDVGSFAFASVPFPVTHSLTQSLGGEIDERAKETDLTLVQLRLKKKKKKKLPAFSLLVGWPPVDDFGASTRDHLLACLVAFRSLGEWGRETERERERSSSSAPSLARSSLVRLSVRPSVRSFGWMSDILSDSGLSRGLPLPPPTFTRITRAEREKPSSPLPLLLPPSVPPSVGPFIHPLSALLFWRRRRRQQLSRSFPHSENRSNHCIALGGMEKEKAAREREKEREKRRGRSAHFSLSLSLFLFVSCIL